MTIHTDMFFHHGVTLTIIEPSDDEPLIYAHDPGTGPDGCDSRAIFYDVSPGQLIAAASALAEALARRDGQRSARSSASQSKQPSNGTGFAAE